MKVFVIDMDNGEDYEDYHHWLEGIFSSRKKAEDYLQSKGWKKSNRLKDAWVLTSNQYGWKVTQTAEIEEREVI